MIVLLILAVLAVSPDQATQLRHLAQPDQGQGPQATSEEAQSPLALDSPEPAVEGGEPAVDDGEMDPGAAPEPAPESPSPASPLPTCEQHEIALGITTDRERYRSGEIVSITFTAVNVRASACYFPLGTYGYSVTDDSGQPVETGLLVHRDYWCDDHDVGHHSCPGRLEPGESITQEETWNQQRCRYETDSGCSWEQVPPGRYVIDGSWGGRNASTSILIEASSRPPGASPSPSPHPLL